MDRTLIESALRRAWAKLHLTVPDALNRATVECELAVIARETMGPRFRFEPDPARVTDATPARMSGLRPVPSARPRFAVVPGGAGESERPSARYVADADDDFTPEAG